MAIYEAIRFGTGLIHAFSATVYSLGFNTDLLKTHRDTRQFVSIISTQQQTTCETIKLVRTNDISHRVRVMSAQLHVHVGVQAEPVANVGKLEKLF